MSTTSITAIAPVPALHEPVVRPLPIQAIIPPLPHGAPPGAVRTAQPLPNNDDDDGFVPGAAPAVAEASAPVHRQTFTRGDLLVLQTLTRCSVATSLIADRLHISMHQVHHWSERAHIDPQGHVKDRGRPKIVCPSLAPTNHNMIGLPRLCDTLAQ